ncbi:DUF2125 domain-containing protein [Loktanella sp. Alg231-35]|uniref:DUF2125 domain-containing protein n=1 Tax=Loktanella sp. Alg231-35 TaxID=1922220 RepID=UPI001F33B6C4|nr:DUF2125 domain-containing protein [Loktanella sp. Alg231-35]
MTYKIGMCGAVCVAALMAGGAAHADVTAEQVWADWKSQMSLYGEDSVSIGAEETSSGTVTVRDVTMSFSDPEVTVETALGDINFNEQSDGTVRITMDESYPITITGEDGVVINVMVTQSNLEMIASGDPDAMNYALTADQYKIALVDVVDADVTFTGDVELAANDVQASYVTTVGDMRETSYEGSIALLDLLVDFQIPGGAGDYVTAAAKYNGMTMAGDMTVPLDADFENPDSLIMDGFAVAGGYVVQSADFVVDINAEGDQFAASGSTGLTTFTGEMNNNTLAYDASVTDLAVNAQTSEFPLPIEISMAEYGLGFAMPTGVTGESADFGINFDLVELAISDGLWDLFDPGNVLPRDPATLQIGLAGKAKALFDLFDPEQAAQMDSVEMPYELESLTLETLNIDAVGTKVTGDGDFTFDNSDMQTFAPMPAPEGEATIEITGLNALLDNLVSAGLVPADQVMGPRMMMGMFMQNTGDDQMETTVEITGNGEVKVNGNRVR